MFRRIRYPIKNIWRNDKRRNGTIPPPTGPGDNEPDNNNNKLFVTIITCVCVYSLNKNKK
jgi:hypothetical protein